jgi:nucleoside phosphorylase
VGAFAAGAGSALALARHTPRAAILIGSYGLYPGHGSFEPGQLLIPSRVCAADSAVLAGRTAFPQAMATERSPHPALSQALAGAHAGAIRGGALATTLGITTDDALAGELAHGSGCEGENLEALAVLLACEGANVPCAILLGCTNLVGSEGRKQWLAHRAEAARATAEHVKTWLVAGAPGLPAA